jgi:hypothetical protein
MRRRSSISSARRRVSALAGVRIWCRRRRRTRYASRLRASAAAALRVALSPAVRCRAGRAARRAGGDTGRARRWPSISSSGSAELRVLPSAGAQVGDGRASARFRPGRAQRAGDQDALDPSCRCSQVRRPAAIGAIGMGQAQGEAGVHDEVAQLSRLPGCGGRLLQALSAGRRSWSRLAASRPSQRLVQGCSFLMVRRAFRCPDAAGGFVEQNFAGFVTAAQVHRTSPRWAGNFRVGLEAISAFQCRQRFVRRPWRYWTQPRLSVMKGSSGSQ